MGLFGSIFIVSVTFLLITVEVAWAAKYFGNRISCDDNLHQSNNRIDCGLPGILESHCLILGCCYDGSNQNNVSCFIGQGGIFSRNKTCSFSRPTERTECGYLGITKSRCEARDCCYDSRVLGAPTCFYSNNTDNGIQQTDIERLIFAQGTAIDALILLKSRILNAHHDYSIAKTVGSSVSIAGTSAMVAGVFLAPFTAGLSLGLTVGGLAGTIAGSTATVTAGIIEYSKSVEWADELVESMGDLENELKRIAEKIVTYPGWLETVRLAGSGVSYVGFKGYSSYQLVKIVRYLIITNIQYGNMAKDASFMFDLFDKGLLKHLKYQQAAGKVTKELLPLKWLLKENNALNRFLTKVGAPTVQVGVTTLKCVSAGLGGFSIGLDIYTIVDTWANDPKLVGQIDELIDTIREIRINLMEFKDEF